MTNIKHTGWCVKAPKDGRENSMYNDVIKYINKICDECFVGDSYGDFYGILDNGGGFYHYHNRDTTELTIEGAYNKFYRNAEFVEETITELPKRQKPLI